MPLILEIEHQEPTGPNELEIFVRNVHVLGSSKNLIIYRNEGRKAHDYAYDLKRRLAKYYGLPLDKIEELLGIQIKVSLGAVRACRTKNWNRPIPARLI